MYPQIVRRGLLAVAALLALVMIALLGSQAPASAAPTDVVGLVSTPTGEGYLMVSQAGQIWAFGDAQDFGSPTASTAVVSLAITSSGEGYWIFGSAGEVYSYGDADFYGSAAAIPLNRPIVAGVAAPDGLGYWLVASDGGVFNYGSAAFFGSAGALPLNRPVVGATAVPDGRGYWLVASDGGVFSYGSARFEGSAAQLPLNKPIIGMTPTISGKGYWLFASDGGVFSYGDTSFFGSGAESGQTFGALGATPSRAGYWLATTGGEVVPFGNAAHYGDPSNSTASCSTALASTYISNDVSQLPVHPQSAAWVNSIGASDTLHPDFGTVYDGAPNGIPFTKVDNTTPRVPVSFLYDEDSDPGPYPIPANPLIEGGPNGDGDRHVLLVNEQECQLYELFDAQPPGPGKAQWSAGSGAIFDMRTLALRPDEWTSADAAGLPMYPLLVKYDEVASGEIGHALRFTVSQTQRAFIHPATHYASSSTDPDRPPMGALFRLKANFDISGYPPEVQVILRALKKHGMYVADNGSDWMISGAPDSRWDDDALRAIKQVSGSAFEAVDTGEAIYR